MESVQARRAELGQSLGKRQTRMGMLLLKESFSVHTASSEAHCRYP